MHPHDETGDSPLTPIPGSEIVGEVRHTNPTAYYASLQWLLASVNGLDQISFSFGQIRDACEDLKINPILLKQAILNADQIGLDAAGSRLLDTFYEVLVEYVTPPSQVAESPQTYEEYRATQFKIEDENMRQVASEPYPNEQAIREATRILSESHTHSFTYLLNANHTALRGCTCGLSFVGHMVGVEPGELRWHRVKEEGEE